MFVRERTQRVEEKILRQIAQKRGRTNKRLRATG